MIPSPAALKDEAGIRGLVDVARRRWLWVVLPVLTAVFVASFHASRQPVTYTATAQVLVADTAAQQALDPSSQNSGFLSRELANEISLARSDAFNDQVLQRLGQIPDVSITADTTADILRFEVTNTDPATAAEYANTWAQVYVEMKQRQATQSIAGAIARFQQRLVELGGERAEVIAPLDDIANTIARTSDTELVASLQRRYDRSSELLSADLRLIDTELLVVSSSISELQLQGQLSRAGTARIVSAATPPSTPSSTPFARRFVVGLSLGLVVGAALAVLVDNVDRTVSTADDVKRVTAIPVLGSIPRPEKRFAVDNHQLELAVANPQTSAIADGYHQVRASLQFLMAVQTLRSILVTSANQSEGKTTTSSNLAWALAATGRHVVLADADFHRPRLRTIYDLGTIGGLTGYSLGSAPTDTLSCLVQSPVADLVVLPTGHLPPQPSDFVASQSFHDTLAELVASSDVLVIDAPPVLPLADALEMARNVDGTILTALAGSTGADQLARAIANLEQSGANIVGIVLVGVKAANTYGYGYGTERSPGLATKLRRMVEARSERPASPPVAEIDLRDPPPPPPANAPKPSERVEINAHAPIESWAP